MKLSQMVEEQYVVDGFHEEENVMSNSHESNLQDDVELSTEIKRLQDLAGV
jgi:hypothetical protein